MQLTNNYYTMNGTKLQPLNQTSTVSSNPNYVSCEIRQFCHMSKDRCFECNLDDVRYYDHVRKEFTKDPALSYVIPK